MKKISAIKNQLSTQEVLTTEQAAQIKGGDDQRSPRPGGGGPVGLISVPINSGNSNSQS